MRPRWKATALVLALATGCVAGDDEAQLDVAHSELVGGSRTSIVPAVGYISVTMPMDCTATLIQRRAILSAAHCFHWLSRSDRGASGTFTFNNGLEQRTIVRYTSLTTDVNDGMNDIAVAELDRDVFSDNVPPQALSVNPPTDPQGQAHILGYGCDNPQPTPGGGFVCAPDAPHEKNLVSFPSGWLRGFELSSNETGRQSTLTNHDSGGPLYNADWQIFGVSSRTTVFSDDAGNWVETRDYFANVSYNRVRIIQAVEAFND